MKKYKTEKILAGMPRIKPLRKQHVGKQAFKFKSCTWFVLHSLLFFFFFHFFVSLNIQGSMVVSSSLDHSLEVQPQKLIATSNHGIISRGIFTACSNLQSLFTFHSNGKNIKNKVNKYLESTTQLHKFA